MFSILTPVFLLLIVPLFLFFVLQQVIALPHSVARLAKAPVLADLELDGMCILVATLSFSYIQLRKRSVLTQTLHQRGATALHTHNNLTSKKGKGRPYSIAERSVPQQIPVLGSLPAGDVSHKPGGRLPLLSARLAVTLATLKRGATNFAAW